MAGKDNKNAPETVKAETLEQAAREAKDAGFQSEHSNQPAPALSSISTTPGPTSGTADGNEAAARLEALQKDANDSTPEADFWLNVRGKNGWKKQSSKSKTLEEFKAEADDITTKKDTDVQVMNLFGSEVYLGQRKIDAPAEEPAS